MHEFLMLLGAWAAGLSLGAVFFGGLWWTVRQGVSSSQAALWFMGSMWLRMSIVLPGFYWVGSGDWRRLGGCLLGFVIARFAVVRLARLAPKDARLPAKEAGHAP